MRRRGSVPYALIAIFAAFPAIVGFKVFNNSLPRGLEEEKSYARCAMEYDNESARKKTEAHS
jgi:hypothetical protein